MRKDETRKEVVKQTPRIENNFFSIIVIVIDNVFVGEIVVVIVAGNIVKTMVILLPQQHNDDLLQWNLQYILISCQQQLGKWICRTTSYRSQCKWSFIVFMVLAGKHSIDIRTSGRVFARTAHQHSRFRATTLPSTSWQTLWQHSNSSLWHCHTDFHAGYQHKWHNAITVLCSKYHFNIGWTNITLNIAKNISIHITSHRLQLDIGRTVAAAVSCRLPTGTCCHWCHRRCHPPPSMSSYSMSSSIIKCNLIVLYQFQTQLSMSSYPVWSSSSIHANIWVLCQGTTVTLSALPDP